MQIRFIAYGIWNSRGNAEEAERMFRDVLLTRRKVLPEGQAQIADMLTGLGESLTSSGSLTEAEQLLREALKTYHETLPDEHVRIAQAESVLGACLTKQGSYDEAEAYLVRSYPRLKEGSGVRESQVRSGLERLIALYIAWEKPLEVAKWKAELDQMN